MANPHPSLSIARESVFTWDRLVFGEHAMDELKTTAAQLKLRNVLVVSDPRVQDAGITDRAEQLLRQARTSVQATALAQTEPTDTSLTRSLTRLAGLGADDIDGIIAVGGGSVLDTAKALNLLITNGATLLDYINVPVGRGQSPTRPLLPLIAIPTTAGSGSESSAVCVIDLTAQHIKSGISHSALRPDRALIDPLATLSVPAEVTAASGLDTLAHALESLTCLPYDARPRHHGPTPRPTFSGANPLSTPLCLQALRLLGRSLRRAVEDGSNIPARHDVMLAATLTAVGSSSAGVHIPHACSYSIGTLTRTYHPPGYPHDKPFVPHGHAVALTLPATLRHIAHTHGTQRIQQQAARALAPHSTQPLADIVTTLLRDLHTPAGLSAVGYTAHDIDTLTQATLPQHRLLAGAPCPTTPDDIATILRNSLHPW